MKNLRIILIYFFIFLFSAALIGKLYYLQILKGDFYKALSQGLHNSFDRNLPERGEIFFRNGKELAINVSLPFLVINSKEIKNIEETTKILSQILNLDESFISGKLKNESPYLIIKRKLSPAEIEALKKANLEGAFLEEERVRYYPQENLASKVVGFLNTEGKGQYGLEEYYDETLQSGKNIYLTLDYNLQFKTEKLLEKAKEGLDIEAGQIIVIEPNSGEILALADFPNFNPGEYQKEENFEIFKNGATQKLFEPGSIFKPLTIAGALQEQKITPQTTYIDKGNVKIGGWTIYNYENRIWGERTMTEVLEWSINTGAVFAEKQLGHHFFLKYLEKFGIFEKTGIDLPEIYSENREFKKGYEINFATASFGQGIEVTPIQIIRATCAIANGGKLIRPHLVLNKEGEEPPSEVISKETASKLTKMLISVVENGYGKRAKISGYFIAGKTGTSQIPFSSLGIQKSGYSEKTWQSFLGFFPAFNPRFLILVKLDNPKAKVAGASTTLIAKELIEYLISYYQIPPDYEAINE